MLRRAGQGISPEEVHALPAVEVAQLVGIYLYCFGVIKFQQLLKSYEIDIVCWIDGLRGAENIVCHWYPAA